MRLRATALILVVVTAACGRQDLTPTATVRDFLDVMDRSENDETALREAYGYLQASARRELQRRAERARMLSRQPFEPWQMLVQGRFRLRFLPRSPGGMRERIDGERAVVTVLGDTKKARADVQLVREQGKWRIALEIPRMQSDSSDGPRSDG